MLPYSQFIKFEFDLILLGEYLFNLQLPAQNHFQKIFYYLSYCYWRNEFRMVVINSISHWNLCVYVEWYFIERSPKKKSMKYSKINVFLSKHLRLLPLEIWRISFKKFVYKIITVFPNNCLLKCQFCEKRNTFSFGWKALEMAILKYLKSRMQTISHAYFSCQRHFIPSGRDFFLSLFCHVNEFFFSISV